jgi:hypothetical protein
MAEIAGDTEAPNVEKIFTDNFKDVPKRLMIVGTLPDVEAGKEACEDCQGRGREHECPSCSCICQECGGSGDFPTSSDDNLSMTIAGSIFAVKYIRLLQTLPGVKIETVPAGTSPMSSEFDGGVGLLMPMRSQYDRHIDVAV